MNHLVGLSVTTDQIQCIRIKTVTTGGQQDRFAQPIEQVDSQLVLEPPNVGSDGGLGVTQAIGCSLKSMFLYDRDKGNQLTIFHIYPPIDNYDRLNEKHSFYLSIVYRYP
nr:hypothetical protein [uncultured Marinococcus sp.]